MASVAHSADELCSRAGLGDEARALLREGAAPKEYVAALMEHGQFTDAVRLLAHALPKREAVWWAWVCARRAAGTGAAPAVQASLTATEKWIAQPTDEHRWAAMKAAEIAGFETAAGCAGLAAFLSGASLAPPNLPPAPPDPSVSARAVAGAIILAAVGDPKAAGERFRAFLAQGLEVVARLKLW